MAKSHPNNNIIFNSISGVDISNQLEIIIRSSEKYSLCIKGESGTGKSTLLSLLYLAFPKDNQYNLKYIDLHHEDKKKLAEFIKNLTSKKPKKPRIILFIDGIDSGLYDEILEFAKEKSVIKVICAITTTTKIEPKITKFSQKFAETLSLNLIQDNNDKGVAIVNELLKPTDKKNKDVDKKIMKLAFKASGRCAPSTSAIAIGCTDFRTINFLVEQYNEKPNILSQLIGQIYYSYYSSEITKNPNTNSLHKGRAMRNFMYAYSYVHTILYDGTLESIYDNIFSEHINSFVVGIIEAMKKSALFSENARALYDSLKPKQKTQILFFLGRLKGPDNITFLKEQYAKCSSSLDKSAVSVDSELMQFRTAGVSLIHAREDAEGFYEKLIYHPELRELNRLFHMDYYTNEYAIEDNRNLDEADFTKEKIIHLYSYLHNDIMDDDARKAKRIPKGYYYLNIITIMDLVQYDHYEFNGSAKLYNGKKFKFKKLLKKLQEDKGKHINDSTIQKYIQNISTPWANHDSKSPIEDNHVHSSLMLMLYKLKITIREGWLKKERRIDKHERPESVADHSWACMLIATIFLSENIETCSFMKGKSLTKYKDYSKSKILQLLFIHDLAESYTGDVENNEQRKEFIDKIKVYDSFSCFSSFHTISDLITEFDGETTINALIAFDIDKIEPLIQLLIYKDKLEEPKKAISEWKLSIIEKLQTELGREIYRFLDKELFPA